MGKVGLNHDVKKYNSGINFTFESSMLQIFIYCEDGILYQLCFSTERHAHNSVICRYIYRYKPLVTGQTKAYEVTCAVWVCNETCDCIYYRKLNKLEKLSKCKGFVTVS
jgi:hypothetical protein